MKKTFGPSTQFLKHRRRVLLLSLAGVITSIPSANGWDVGTPGVNEIGDRQFVAFETDQLNTDVNAFLGIGCTETLFEIKIVSDESYDTSKKIRIRYDLKPPLYWVVAPGPTTNDGIMQTVEFQKPEVVFKKLLTSKTLVVQLTTQYGGFSMLKFNVSNTTKLRAGLKAAGCKV